MAIPHLKSRRNCPPNGFQYKQTETGWYLQTWDFALLCTELQKHRLANAKYRLSTDMSVIEEEVDVANARRVAMMGPDAESYITEFGQQGLGATPKPIPPQPRSSRSVAAVVGRLKSGYDLLKEWKESGLEQVSSTISTLRASICSRCPINSKGDLTSFFTIPLANQIHSQVEDFNQLSLATPFDDKLGVCDACLCPLRLKVHTPIELIVKHLSADVRRELYQPRNYPESELKEPCWILQAIV